MRRPLDWIVVSIALLVLLVNQWRAGTDATAGTLAAESPPRAALQIRDDKSPFGYILEDGSEIYLPMKQSSPHSTGDAPASATAAVFTWSAQATATRDVPMLQ